MLISGNKPIPLAVPYAGMVSVVPVKAEAHRFQVISNASEERLSNLKVPAPEQVNFTGDDQRRQHGQALKPERISSEKNQDVPRTMVGSADILGELINRMGGTGVYSGPGKVLSISV